MTLEPRRITRVTPQVVIGLGIVIWGLMLTAGNLGWLDIRNVLDYWPLLIVAWGVAKISCASMTSGRIVGGLAIAVGFGLLADNLGWMRFHVGDWWPLIFVFVGFRILSRSGSRTPATPDGVATTSDQVVNGFAFWSSVRRRIVSPVFQRADLTAVMGGVQLDLRGASAAGGEAVIDVFAMWGGIEIWVSPDWTVSNQATAIMGAVEDSSTATADARQRLVVRGFVLMGGVEIKT